MPGVYLDVASEYPTVYVLQGLWRYQIASGITWHHQDAGAFEAFVAGLSPADVLKPFLWSQLAALVKVAPDDDRLPTRASFGGGSAHNVAVARREGGPPVWITAADYLASYLHTGRVPKAAEVIRFEPLAPQDDLCAVEVAGQADYRIAPYRDDLIGRMVELRAEVRGELARARTTGDDGRAALLDAAQQGMKVTANSVSYGATIEMNVVEHSRPEWVTIHRPDGSTHRCQTKRTEEPGNYFHPLLAILVSGGGRLMLALAMRLVGDLGGTYAFCDTDSLFVVATEHGEGDPALQAAGVQPLSWAQVQTEVVERFASLNPFGGVLAGRSVLKVEDENFYPGTDTQRELWCLAIASKRYALATRDADGRPELVGDAAKPKRSEHGLGHLLAPESRDPASQDKAWCDTWWEMLFCEAWGLDYEEPEWFDDPAVGRLTVTSPREEQTFRFYNAKKRRYARRVRPWNFAMVAYPTALERIRKAVSGTLVAPYESAPTRRLKARWVDRGGESDRAWRIRTGSAGFVVDGAVAVRSYREVFEEYRMHPEAKAAGPDGKPCAPWTVGQLQPLVVEGVAVSRIGKETNRLAEDLVVVDDAADRAIEYPEKTCQGCGVSIEGRRQKRWCSEACRKRAGRNIVSLNGRSPSTEIGHGGHWNSLEKSRVAGRPMKPSVDAGP